VNNLSLRELHAGYVKKFTHSTAVLNLFLCFVAIPERIRVAPAMLTVSQGMNSLRTMVCLATASLAVPPQGSCPEPVASANKNLTVL
jgi:hypothetical protein